MKFSKFKNTILVIITFLMCFFCYSIYEKPDNIPSEDVLLYVKPKSNAYQVIHTSKLYGTNYSILAKFNLKNDSDLVGESINFILTNYGGLMHYKIDSVSIDAKNDFTITLSKSFFKNENDPYILDCSNNNYRIETNLIKDSHIFIKNFFGGLTNEKILLGFKSDQKFCCGRRCKFQFTN